MMNGSALARRYADGFLEYASQTIGFEKAMEELNDAKRVFKTNPDLLEFLASPAITFEEKRSFIERAFGKDFSPEVRQFLELLLRAGRIDHFIDIAEYARIKYAHGREVDALLEASYPLDTEAIESIKGALETKLKVKLHLYMELDPTLLGGIRVAIGNKVIDGSIQKRFEDLRSKLEAVKVA